ncbi:MAG: hypothetical protein K6B14_08645 [Lachnospiraceae bacterium]|nr:hypothetical protein [Lachnospiraceae bacterium]
MGQRKYLKRNNVTLIIDLASSVMDKVPSSQFALFCDKFFDNPPIDYKEASGVGNIKKAKVEARRIALQKAFNESEGL